MESFVHEFIDQWRESLGSIDRHGKLMHQWSTSTLPTPAEPKDMKTTPVPGATSLPDWWSIAKWYEGRGAIEEVQKQEKNLGRLIMLNGSHPHTMLQVDGKEQRRISVKRVHYIQVSRFEAAYDAHRHAVGEGRPVLMPSLNCHGPLTPQSVQALFTDIDVKVAGDLELARVLEFERRGARAVEAMFSTLFALVWPQDGQERWTPHWGFLRVREVRPPEKAGEKWRFGYHVYTDVALPPQDISLLMMVLRGAFSQGFEEMVLTEGEFEELQRGREKKMEFALDDVTTTGLRLPNSFKVVERRFFGGFYEMDPAVSPEEYERRWRTVMRVATVSAADRSPEWCARMKAVEGEVERQPVRAALGVATAIPLDEARCSESELKLVQTVRHAWAEWVRAFCTTTLRPRKGKVGIDAERFLAVDWSQVYATRMGRASFVIKFQKRSPCVFCYHRIAEGVAPEHALYVHESETNVNFFVVTLHEATRISVSLFCYAPSCRYVTLADLETKTEKVKHKRHRFVDDLRTRLEGRAGDTRHFSIAVPVVLTGALEFPVFGAFEPEEGVPSEKAARMERLVQQMKVERKRPALRALEKKMHRPTKYQRKLHVQEKE